MSEPTYDLVPEASPSWFTDQWIEETLRVWGPIYEKQGIVLTTDDAIEIIRNTDRFVRYLLEVVRKEQQAGGGMQRPDKAEHDEPNSHRWTT